MAIAASASCTGSDRLAIRARCACLHVLEKRLMPGHASTARPRPPRSGADRALQRVRALAWACCLCAFMVHDRPAAAGRADYTGPEACGRCHPEAYAAWQASAHARAGELLAQDASAASRCLACHTTGEAPAGRAFFGSVTCEACHGPGAGYAPEDIMRNPYLSRALGLRDLSTPEQRAILCRGCHRAQTRLAPFDPETAYQRIEHR